MGTPLNLRKKPLAGSGGGAKSRTPIEAADSIQTISFARFMDIMSEGPCVGLASELKSYYCDDTPIENADGSRNFKNVLVDVRLGELDQPHVEGLVAAENEIAVGVEVKTTQPWTRNISNTTLDSVRVRLGWPSGLKKIQGNQDTTATIVEYAIDLAVDGGPFVEVFRSLVNEKASSQFERSHRIGLPAATIGWLLKVRRITPDSTSQLVTDKMAVNGFTEIIEAKLTYPGTAYVVTQIDGSQFQSVPQRAFDWIGRIVRVPSNYNAVTRTYTGIWDGTFTLAYTNNPAWCAFDLVTHRRYGLGKRVDPSVIEQDKWTFYEIARYCDEMVPDGFGGLEPRFTMNILLQDRAEAYRVLSDMFGSFNSMLFWGAGGVRISQDKPAPVDYVYTRANVSPEGFQYTGTSRTARHNAVLVAWNDQSDMSRQKVEYVEDAADIAKHGLNQIEIQAFGCTSRGQAIRKARAQLLNDLMLDDAVSFTVGLDKLKCVPGSIIEISDPKRMGQRMGGRIASATDTVITIDHMPPQAPVAGDILTCILPSGKPQKRTIDAVSGRSISVSVPFDAAPLAEAVWQLERATLVAQQYRVMSITPKDDSKATGGMKFEISAVKHEPSKYAAIDYGRDLDPLPTFSKYVPHPPEGLSTSSRVIVEHGSSQTVVTLSWDTVVGASFYQLEYRFNGGNWMRVDRVAGSTYEIYSAPPGTIQWRIQSVSLSGSPSPPQLPVSFIIPENTTPATAIVQAMEDAANALAAVDGEIVYTESNTAPPSPGYGDIWRRKSDGKIFRFIDNAWVERPNDALALAIIAAAGAQGVADGAVKLYVSETQPTGLTASDIGDQWLKPSTKQLAVWTGSAFVSIQDYDAQSKINTILADGIIDRGEKRGEIIRWQEAINSLSSDQSKADAAGVSRTSFDAAYTALETYINSLSPALTNTSADTPVDAETYRSRWSNYLTQRALLLNAIAQATVDGVTRLNSPMSNGVKDPYFQTADWVNRSGHGYVAEGYYGRALLMPAAAGLKWWTYDVKVDAGRGYTLSGEIYRDNLSGSAFFNTEYLDANKNPISFGDSFGLNKAGVWERISNYRVMPAGTGYLRIYCEIGDTTGSSYFRLIAHKDGHDSSFSDDTAVANVIAGLDIVLADGIIDRSEKRSEIMRWTKAQNERLDLISRASTAGVSSTNYSTAYTILSNYIGTLSNFNDVAQDTPVNGATYRGNWSAYYTEFEALVRAVEAKMGQTATWNGVSGSGKPQDNATVGAPAGTKVNGVAVETLTQDVETAKVDANNALVGVGIVVSDSQLTGAEKRGERIRWGEIYNQLDDLRTKAANAGISATAMNAAATALNDYLLSLSPSFHTSQQTTPIVADTYRQKWTDFYDQRTLLLNAIADKARKTANWGDVGGAGKPADNADRTQDNFAKGTSIPDTRSTNQMPLWYRQNYANKTVSEFKDAGVMGAGLPGGTFGTLYTEVGWDHWSGGAVRQEFTSIHGVYVRQGLGDDSGWTTWQKSYDGQNKPVLDNDVLDGVSFGRTSQTDLVNNRIGLRVPGSNQRIGDQRNLSKSITSSYGSVRSADALSATSDGVIHVNAHTVYYGGVGVPYSGVSNAISGLTQNQEYDVYCYDADYQGGVRTWYATTDTVWLMQQGDAVHRAGRVWIPATGSYAGGSGGGTLPSSTTPPSHGGGESPVPYNQLEP